ncbi:MAG: lipocalin family protein [Pikeienuella sp.]
MPRISRRRSVLALASLLVGSLLADKAAAGSPPAVRPVSGFAIERYLGTWHEIAAIPTSFQKDCVAETTATYALAEDGDDLVVLNGCLEADGTRATAEGRARFTGPRDTGALEVTFVQLFGLWLWPLAGDYIVIGLGEDYRWAAIGHPSRDFGWILARSKTLEPQRLGRIEALFREAGYDSCRLLLSPRTPGAPRPPLCALP